MILGKKVVVVLPAYNAEKTLQSTFGEIPKDLVDEIVLVDDASRDNTVALAKAIGIRHVITHDKNKGYGANQKTCYKKALELGADIIVMLHPDYQYTPKLIPAMVSIIASGLYQVVLGSRILGKGARSGGMPLYKYLSNRFLTLAQNMLMGQKLSEYHTGYRAFSRVVLEKINLWENSDDFVFDNQMLAQICFAGFEIAEVTCPTKYFKGASSINFARSVKYGMGVLAVATGYRMQKWGLGKFGMYRTLEPESSRSAE
jgi:glycosyltransferase involved in cell wall biosynthesis